MTVKLGDICSFQSGGTPSKTNADYFSGDIPWITTVALNGQTIGKTSAVDWITEKAIEESAAKIVPARSIMVGTRVGVGKVAINEIPMSTSQDIISLVGINESLWSKEFLCKFIQSKETYLKSQARGATIKGIKIDVLASLDLPDVSFDSQQEIVAAIDKAQIIIAARRSQLSSLEDLIKARFVEMFGDHQESQSGIPLEDLSEMVTVGIANAATHAYVNRGVLMFRNLNIKENELDDSDLIYIDPEFAAKYSSKTLKKDDILVTRTGYPGQACLVPEKYAGAQTFTTLIVRLRENDELLPAFVCHYINSPFGKRFVKTNQAGVAQQNFGATALGKMPIVIPPIESQRTFVAFTKQIDKSKSVIQKSLDETQLLFDSLMQQYFG